MRTFRLDLEKRIGKQLNADHAILIWLVMHVGWLHTRSQVHADSHTSYEKLFLKRYKSPVLQFGESAWCRKPGPQLNKLDEHWDEGLWLGRASKSDEHIMGIKNGILLVRAVKRKPAAEKWSAEDIINLKWTPWEPSSAKR